MTGRSCVKGGNRSPAVAELKTKQTRASVTSFLNTIEEPEQRADVRKIAAIMRDVTGTKAAGRFVVRVDGRIDRGHRNVPDNDLHGVTSG